MSFACPNCKMFQTQGLSPYGQCQHCGWSLQNSQRELPPTSEIMPLSKYENIVIKNLIEEKDRRIAELEREVERLKKPSIADILKANGKDPNIYGSGLNDQRFESDLLDAVEICPLITEEGEG